MSKNEFKDQFQEKSRHVRLSGGESAGNQLTEVVESEGRVSEIVVEGQGDISLEIVAADPDTNDTLAQYTLAGSSSYNVGSFDSPLFKFGAASAIQINTLTPNGGSTIIGINLTIHERKG
jgi:hypothetical protein